MRDHREKTSFVLTKSLTFLMAVVCGVSVANLYYIQPLESQLAETFHVTQGMAGIATTLTQAGYAFGLLLFVPLGDICERRALILRMLRLVAVFLLAIAASPAYAVLLIAVFSVGITTIVPQLIVPYAAHLALPEERGKIIGDVMSGLLIGILLSRTFSGFLGSMFGWRTVYLLAALLIIILSILIRWFFPLSPAVSNISYRELLASLFVLVKKERCLRESSICGFLMFGSFSAFWVSLIFLLETPTYGMGAREAGLFGLAGAAGAFIAPLVGKAADKKSPRFTVGIGILLTAAAYLCFTLFGFHLWGLIVGVIVLDLGVQSAQVSNMARVQALGDEVRSRTNTVYMFTYFVGGSFGSFFGTLFWQSFGWYGVCAVGLTFQCAALISHFIIYRKQDKLT